MLLALGVAVEKLSTPKLFGHSRGTPVEIPAGGVKRFGCESCNPKTKHFEGTALVRHVRATWGDWSLRYNVEFRLIIFINQTYHRCNLYHYNEGPHCDRLKQVIYAANVPSSQMLGILPSLKPSPYNHTIAASSAMLRRVLLIQQKKLFC